MNTFIFGAMRYQVTAVAVVARTVSGGDKYIYRHGVLPGDTDPVQIEHLLEFGLIRKIEGATA